MSPCRPTPPPDFNFIQPSNPHGLYVFGFPEFQVRPLQVANIFHRSFAGPHEDFILGVLSVLLIALLTEIFQVVLMRTAQRRVTRSGLHAAFVLDEVTHFRNVFSHVRKSTRSRVTKSVMWSSLTILTIGFVLIAAEVFAVYITQPFQIYAHPDQYNLRGIQPVTTNKSVAIDVDKLTEKKRCISPMMPDSNQSRQFSINACVDRTLSTAMEDPNSKATYVEFGSWYHKAGSNHVISYGNTNTGEKGEHTIQTRAAIMQGELGIGSGIRFESVDTENGDYAKYLQGSAMQAAIESICEDGSEKVDCEPLFDACQIETPSRKQRKEITLWEISNTTGVEVPVTAVVEGIVTRYKVELKDPRVSLKSAFRVFATSAAIEEVDGEGMYVSMPDGEELDTIERLASEEGRIAGVVLLGTVLLAMFGLLIVLRIFLKPVSLARLARDSIEEQDDDFLDDDDEFVGAGPDVSQSVYAFERDIVEPDLDDYGSTDAFDLPPARPPRHGFWHPHDPGPYVK